MFGRPRKLNTFLLVIAMSADVWAVNVSTFISLSTSSPNINITKTRPSAVSYPRDENKLTEVADFRLNLPHEGEFGEGKRVPKTQKGSLVFMSGNAR